MTLVVKAIGSILLIMLANMISRKSPALGGWITAFPLVTLLSISWMATDQRTPSEIVHYLRGVTIGLLPTFALLLVWVIALRHGFSLAVGFGLAIAVWITITIAAKCVGTLG